MKRPLAVLLPVLLAAIVGTVYLLTRDGAPLATPPPSPAAEPAPDADRRPPASGVAATVPDAMDLLFRETLDRPLDWRLATQPDLTIDWPGVLPATGSFRFEQCGRRERREARHAVTGRFRRDPVDAHLSIEALDFGAGERVAGWRPVERAGHLAWADANGLSEAEARLALEAVRHLQGLIAGLVALPAGQHVTVDLAAVPYRVWATTADGILLVAAEHLGGGSYPDQPGCYDDLLLQMAGSRLRRCRRSIAACTKRDGQAVPDHQIRTLAVEWNDTP